MLMPGYEASIQLSGGHAQQIAIDSDCSGCTLTMATNHQRPHIVGRCFLLYQALVFAKDRPNLASQKPRGQSDAQFRIVKRQT